MSNIWSRLINLAGNITGTLPVANGGTGLASGTSGGVLGYTASGTLASSSALAAGGVVYGGGAGVTPAATAQGSSSQVLIGGTTPSFGNVPAASLPIVTQSTAGAVSSAGQLLATNTNDAATAGNVGEAIYILNVSRAGMVTFNSNSTSNITGAVTVTAGNWRIEGYLVFTPSTNCNLQGIQFSVSQTSNTLSADSTIGTPTAATGEFKVFYFENPLAITADTFRTIGPYFVNFASSQTVYPVLNVTYSAGTMKVFGQIWATRPR